MDRITRRVLNRTTLHRQSLLDRSDQTPATMIEHVFGMQAQNPHDPYFALWSRLRNFAASDLSAMIEDRQAVRGPLMRATIHLVTTADFLSLRPQLQTVCARTLGSTAFAKDTEHLDRETLLEAGRSLLEDQSMTRAELGRLLEGRWPGVPPNSLAQVVTYLLPVVQVPPRGLWQQSGPAAWTTIERHTGSELVIESSVEDTVRRYLAAFGPASISDVRAWSGLPGLRDIVKEIRPQLRSYTDDKGVELLDLPEATLIDADVPSPPRFLPEYDNVLLGHSDRSRFFLEGIVPSGWRGNLLIDGLFSGAWKVSNGKAGALLEIDLKRKATRSELQAAVEEAERLLTVAYAGATGREVTVLGPG